MNEQQNIKPQKVYVEISEFWGDGCAISTIKISRRTWSKILAGERYEKSVSAYFDGALSTVEWIFENCKLSIIGDDLTYHIEDQKVEELTTEITYGN
jgi:hypothetical protein